jgi:hypothetical protein
MSDHQNLTHQEELLQWLGDLAAKVAHRIAAEFDERRFVEIIAEEYGDDLNNARVDLAAAIFEPIECAFACVVSDAIIDELAAEIGEPPETVRTQQAFLKLTAPFAREFAEQRAPAIARLLKDRLLQ